MEIELSIVPLFFGHTNEEINELLSKVVFQRKSYQKGSLVITQGEVCDRLMILIEGGVKAEMMSMAGKSLKIEDMEAPSVLASAFIFGRRNFFPVNITASTGTRFLVLPKSELMKLFHLSDRILQNFLGMVSSRAQFLSDKLRFHSFKALKSKLANYLISEAGRDQSFKLKHSQNELAELFGVARPSVGRAFLQLQEEGIIDIKYRQLTILDHARLNEACNE